MIFANIKKLREYLISQRKNRKTRDIQREDFPNAKAGTLSRVVNDPSYEPQHKSIRDGLLLSDSCPRCHRKPRRPRRVLPGSPCKGCPMLREFRTRLKKESNGIHA